MSPDEIAGTLNARYSSTKKHQQQISSNGTQVNKIVQFKATQTTLLIHVQFGFQIVSNHG